jgi:hypothetical protein
LPAFLEEDEMDSRLSHALVGIAAAVLTAGAYEVRDAIRETAAAMDKALPSGEVVAAKADKDRAKADKAKPIKERDGKLVTVTDPLTGEERTVDNSKEARTERLAARAEDLGVSLSELREYRLDKKADEKGVSPDDLRDKRQSKRLDADDLMARREARADWREKQDPDDLAARKEARQDRNSGLSEEEMAAKAERREYRQEVVEQYPSVGDAAKVLQQLRVMGQGEEGQ